jgi:hypothetical protein
MSTDPNFRSALNPSPTQIQPTHIGEPLMAKSFELPKSVLFPALSRPPNGRAPRGDNLGHSSHSKRKQFRGAR